jgi:electron transport complex protein RnfG
MLIKHMITTGILLGLFAIAGTTLVGLTQEGTKERIAEAEREALLHSLNAVVDPGRYDNDIFSDTIEVSSLTYLGSTHPVTIYRARQAGKPVAVMFATTAPNGYSGPIRLMIGINADGTLTGVRVINHRETPGLGDDIEIERSNWILGFNGKSLSNPGLRGWRVKRDGGEFDQFTGATITPRAVVEAVHNSLLYFSEQHDELFNRAALAPPEHQEDEHE